MKRFVALVVICLMTLSVVACRSENTTKNPYSQDYVPGQGNIQGDVDVEAFLKRDARFDIGADKKGVAVFKDPDAAFQALLEKYAGGIDLIKKENSLTDLSPNNVEAYKTYGWQVTTGSEEDQDEARFVSRFLDI